MPETPITFGEGGHLVGILSRPEPGQHKAGTPAVLMWNAGLLHRIGPARLYVDLSREMAQLGLVALRFDLSGIGDSEPAPTSRVRRERVTREIRAAMDYLESNGIAHHCVLIGLCSGADEAHHVAVADERVRGVLQLDGYAYPTLRFRLRRCADFLGEPRRVCGYLQRCFGRVARTLRPSPDWCDSDDADFSRRLPPRKVVEDGMRKLIARGTRLYFIYTGEADAAYNYPDQFRDMFPSLDIPDSLCYELFAEADHTFTSVASRVELMERIRRWIDRNFAGVKEAAVRANDNAPAKPACAEPGCRPVFREVVRRGPRPVPTAGMAHHTS